jgi:hypothetical protein
LESIRRIAGGVQMVDLQARQRLLAQEHNVWQQYGRQMAPWNYSMM